MSDTRTKEQREADWWAEWWKEDYTWEGLAKKPLRGWVVADGLLREAETGRIYGQSAPEVPAPIEGKDASIQDYWRANPVNGQLRNESEMAAELADALNQPLFHSVHLPLVYANGSPSGKQTWNDNALNRIVEGRINAAKETFWSGPWHSRKLVGADGRAQFAGAVLIAGSVRPSNEETVLSIKANRAAFTRSARFEVVAFSGDTDFENSMFQGDASFSSASFAGEARFAQAEFSGVANFNGTEFEGDARFGEAKFSGVASFNRVIFQGEAIFGSTSFFNDANFLGARFAKAARFRFSVFARTLSFEPFILTDRVVFDGPAEFGGAIFEGAVQFDAAIFMDRLSFDASLFRRFADFSGVRLPDHEAHWRGAFDGALFEATLDARGIPEKCVSLFAGARFDRGVMLERVDETSARQGHAEALGAACAADDREVALRALESGALKLKQAMEAEKDYSREQRFHRLELRARRKRKDTPWTEKVFSGAYLTFARYGGSIGVPAAWLGAAIAVFAGIYWGLEQGPGRIGASLSRLPVERSPDPNLVEAARYSLSRVFPLGTWDDSDEPVRVVVDEAKRSAAPLGVQADCSFRERLVAAGGCRPAAVDFKRGASLEDRSRLELHRTFIAMLSTLQTVFAGALYFLLGLAVRRKFQIS